MPTFRRVLPSVFGAIAASVALSNATAMAQGDCPRAMAVRVP